MEMSFADRKSLLYDGYLLMKNFIKFDNDKWYKLTNSELDFIEYFINFVEKFYKILRICHIDAINNSIGIKETLENIIKDNTCFIKEGISANFPSFIIVLCEEIVPNYIKCYNSYAEKLLKKEYNNFQDNFIKAKCSKADFDFFNKTLIIDSEIIEKRDRNSTSIHYINDNFTEIDANSIINFIKLKKFNINNTKPLFNINNFKQKSSMFYGRFVFLMFIFVGICLILLVLGVRYYRRYHKRITNQRHDENQTELSEL
ncbi:putative SP-containing membrane protein [Vairimorpha necatrix]|uniref:SP-containing membrane protein n=1 Tax=Vairimorpha necatrix TaxID=6039 RepID=A0AAX4JCE1_9MICR